MAVSAHESYVVTVQYGKGSGDGWTPVIAPKRFVFEVDGRQGLREARDGFAQVVREITEVLEDG